MTVARLPAATHKSHEKHNQFLFTKNDLSKTTRVAFRFLLFISNKIY